MTATSANTPRLTGRPANQTRVASGDPTPGRDTATNEQETAMPWMPIPLPPPGTPDDTSIPCTGCGAPVGQPCTSGECYPNGTLPPMTTPAARYVHVVSDLRHWAWRLLGIVPRSMCGERLIDDGSPEPTEPCPFCPQLEDR